jgi:hypothetical protein
VSESRPTLLLWLALIATVEAVALLAVVIVNAVGAIGDGKVNLGLLLGGEFIWLLGAGAMALIAWGLSRRARAARTPFVLAQLFALIMAYPLIGHHGAWIALGVGIGLVALTGVIIALSPRAGAEFN